MLKGFKDFLLRGNVVDLAVAVVIGTAFGALITSFTESFINPLIGLLFGGGVDGGTFVVDGQAFTVGAFINAIITFIIIAAAVYFVVVVPVQKLMEMRKRGDVDEVEATPEDIALLQEIRDLLRQRQA
jgi:large conductance mechanosensitive channel